MAPTYEQVEVRGRGVYPQLCRLFFQLFKSHPYGSYLSLLGGWLLRAGYEIVLMLSTSTLITAQESKAAAILTKYHANASSERDPLIMFEMAQIRHAIRKEEEINKYTSYWSLFSTPSNRRRMRIIIAIAIFAQWR